MCVVIQLGQLSYRAVICNPLYMADVCILCQTRTQSSDVCVVWAEFLLRERLETLRDSRPRCTTGARAGELRPLFSFAPIDSDARRGPVGLFLYVRSALYANLTNPFIPRGVH